MTRYVRTLCVSVAGLLLLLLSSSNAAAVLSVNGSSFTLASTNLQLTSLTSPTPITTRCTTAVLNTTVALGGAVTIAPSRALFSGCSINSVVATVTQTSAWSGTLTALLSGGRITGVLLRITIPAGGLRLTSVGGSSTRGGTVSALATVTPATPPALACVSSFTFANAALDALGLIVDSSTGIPPVATLESLLGLFTSAPQLCFTLV